MASHRVAIALGSNVGDRRAHLDYGVIRLRDLLTDFSLSSFVETDPVGVGPQPTFLNGAVVGLALAAPRELLASLREIEAERWRERPYPGAPRTLDLDLILYGQTIIDEPDLVIPHPRFRDREFVLAPLVELAPSLVDPVTGLTVRELLTNLKR